MNLLLNLTADLQKYFVQLILKIIITVQTVKS